LFCGVVASCAAEIVAVVAVVVSVECEYEDGLELSRQGMNLPGERIVPYASAIFDGEYQCSIIGPLKPKEAC
jgi:hypothetical protein